MSRIKLLFFSEPLQVELITRHEIENTELDSAEHLSIRQVSINNQ